MGLIVSEKLILFHSKSSWGGGILEKLTPLTDLLTSYEQKVLDTTQRDLRIRDRKLLQKKLNTDLNMSDLFLQGYICIFKNNPQIWFLMLWKKWLQSLVDIIFTKKFIYKFSLKHQLFFPFQRIKSWSTIDLFLIYRWSTMYISTLGGQSTFRPLVDNRHFYSW